MNKHVLSEVINVKRNIFTKLSRVCQYVKIKLVKLCLTALHDNISAINYK